MQQSVPEMDSGPASHSGRRLNPLFPLAADPSEKKEFRPLQAVQNLVADVRSKFDKTKPKSDIAVAVSAVAAATRANPPQSQDPSPAQSQSQAKGLIESLSKKGFVLAKIRPADESDKPSNPAAIITKEELGRGTWTFLHTLAVQYPKIPTKQQQKDVKTLVRHSLSSCYLAALLVHSTATFLMAAQVDVLTRMYPCTECAQQFAEIVK